MRKEFLKSDFNLPNAEKPAEFEMEDYDKVVKESEHPQPKANERPILPKEEPKETTKNQALHWKHPTQEPPRNHRRHPQKQTHPRTRNLALPNADWTQNWTEVTGNVTNNMGGASELEQLNLRKRKNSGTAGTT